MWRQILAADVRGGNTESRRHKQDAEGRRAKRDWINPHITPIAHMEIAMALEIR